MIQKESLSDESLMNFSSLDKYLINSNNQNALMAQKQMHQNINIQQPNLCYVGNNQGMVEDNMRSRACFNPNVINPNQYIHGGQQYRMPVMINQASILNDKLTMNNLYTIAGKCPPIDRLTLPVDGGDLYGPFVLPMDQIVHEVEFNLSDDSLNQINIRDDLDIVLLSKFNKENAMKFLSWPSSIKIFVNDNLLTLDMASFNRIPLHTPQFIKRYCLPGRNVVKFEVYEVPRLNLQLFLFNIYMVHRPTVIYSKKLTMDNALVHDELTIKLLQANCLRLKKDSVNISTMCPISNKRIEIPIRFQNCDHLQPFDLMSFLKIEARWMLNICPLCQNTMHLNFNGYQQNIIIDLVLQKMFERVPNTYEMINVDLNGKFTPLISNPSPEYLQMVQQQHNNMMNIQQRQNFHDMNNGMISQSPQRPMYCHVTPEQAMNGQFMQSPPGPQYRLMNPNLNPNINPMMIANRSMLDFSPCDMYPRTMSNTSQSPVKKATKRKQATKKSKGNTDTAVSVASNNCPTPPSIRTSSVASTSSPDSINVPYSVPKRSPSLDHLSYNILSESHLNDELLLYSSASTTNHTTTIFSDSHFMNAIDELVSSLPSISLPSFTEPPSNYFNAHYSQPTQEHLPNRSPTVVNEHPISKSHKDNSNTLDDHSPLSNRSTVTSLNGVVTEDSLSCVSKYVSNILTNYDPVPEINECDWLKDYGPLNHPITFLSDVEDF